MGWGQVSSGLAAIWALENTRESLFGAMERKEVYGTTGSRMAVRFFGGWDFTAADLSSRSPAFAGYEKGVPMGGDLPARSGSQAPAFMVYALRDPIGGNLDRIQIVKGWLDADGTTHEKVYDVIWSGDRRPGPDGKLPPVGNTVDAETANFTNTIGASELGIVWTDPDFDATKRTFYYARVIEIPNTALVHVRSVPFRYPDPRRGAGVDAGAGVHITDLVHAVDCLPIEWKMVPDGRNGHSAVDWIRSWLREPLLHFLLLGTGLFALSGFLGEPTPSDSRVVVTLPSSRTGEWTSAKAYSDCTDKGALTQAPSAMRWVHTLGGNITRVDELVRDMRFGPLQEADGVIYSQGKIIGPDMEETFAVR